MEDFLGQAVPSTPATKPHVQNHATKAVPPPPPRPPLPAPNATPLPPPSSPTISLKAGATVMPCMNASHQISQQQQQQQQHRAAQQDPHTALLAPNQSHFKAQEWLEQVCAVACMPVCLRATYACFEHVCPGRAELWDVLALDLGKVKVRFRVLSLG
jgi:hypothetical protein